MRRIAILGSGGSGKSTLARQLGERLGIEVIHLDALYWRPGWVAPPGEEWVALQRELVGRDAWVMDGNFGGGRELRLAAADTIVFLDLPRLLCLWRILWRRVRDAGRTRPDLAPGCYEGFDWAFTRWVWRYPSETRPKVVAQIAAYAAGRRVVRLRSARAVREFVAGIGR